MTRKLIILTFLTTIFISMGCANNKVKTDMMDTINSERNELIVLESSYRKYNDAVNYFIEVRNSDQPTPLSDQDCMTFYGMAKSSFSDVANNMDTSTYVSLINLKDSSNYLASVADLWLLTCSDNDWSKDKIDLIVALHGKLLENARVSRDAFLNNAQELLNKYDYDLQVYSTYTTQEAEQKKQFWAQFFGALAGSLASGLSNYQSSGSGTYTITDTGNGTFNIYNSRTGETKLCNGSGNIATCF